MLTAVTLTLDTLFNLSVHSSSVCGSDNVWQIEFSLAPSWVTTA